MCAQFSCLSCSVFVTLDCTPHRVAQVSLVRVISWSSHDERISSTLSPPFPSTSSSSHSSLTSCTSSCTSSTTLRAVATLRTSLERRWTLLTTPGFLEDVEYDDTTLEEMLHEAHRVHVYHSQREGLSVGQSSSSVSERTGRSFGERTGRLVGPSGQELNVANAQIRTLLNRQRGSKSSPTVRRKVRNTNSRLIMTEEVYENSLKLLNLSEKNFTALKLKNFNDEAHPKKSQ